MQTNLPTMQPVNKYFLATIVLMLIPLSGLAIDIYVPSLPAVSRYFGVDKALVQLSITVYMAGMGLTQLFAGSISDSFGRKNPLIISMTIFIIITFCLPFSENIYQLLFFRFIQGVSLAVSVVPLRSVIADLFEGREFKKMMNFMTTAWSIGPIIAPAIGGYLEYYFGWKASFYFLGIYSIAVFTLALIYLPETSLHRHPFKLKSIVDRYIQILSHYKFASGVLIDGLLYSIMIIFSIVGPFLIQTVLHYSAIQFGHIALSLGFAWFLGTLTNHWLIDIPLQLKAKICLWSICIILLAMLGLAAIFPVNIYNLVIGMGMLAWIGGIIFPNYFSRSVSLFPTTTGSANALFGSFVFFIAGISSGFGTLLKSTSDAPMIIAYIVLILLCLALFYFERMHKSTSIN